MSNEALVHLLLARTREAALNGNWITVKDGVVKGRTPGMKEPDVLVDANLTIEEMAARIEAAAEKRGVEVYNLKPVRQAQ